MTVPVLTIDGPSGSGKGTVGRRVALALDWHYLDSGALYRCLAKAALERGIPVTDVAALVTAARELRLGFSTDARRAVLLDGIDVTTALQTEEVGGMASRIASLGPVRHALVDAQRAFRCPPGLVADGRDMGTVIFADASCKIFLIASPETRAMRRYKQLIEKGQDVNLRDLTLELVERDRRDRERAEAPLRPAEDAFILDSSDLTIDGVVAAVLARVKAR